MRVLSSVIAEIYQAAQTLPSAAFRNQLLQQMRRVIRFDGAILGLSDWPDDLAQPARIVRAHVHRREPDLVSDYLKISPQDLMRAARTLGMGRPLRCQCLPIRGSWPARSGWIRLVKKYNLAQLLIFGNAPSASNDGYWLVLCRSDPRTPFLLADADSLRALWPHLLRARTWHMQQILNRHDPAAARRSLALVDRLGRIEIADPAFAALLRQEFGEQFVRQIPEPAWQALKRKSEYRGKRANLSARPQREHVVCEARPVRAVDCLGPAERKVAAQFVQGLDYKTIAIAMQTSPHTVRNQLAQIYKKLDVHNKAALALLMQANSR